jgi:hypothetical protein
MKNPNQTRISRIALCLLIITAGFQSAFSQATPALTSFKILFESTPDGLRLTCPEGCSWKEVTFSLSLDQVQAVNQYGMTTLDESPAPKSELELPAFLFTVKMTKDGLSFEGKQGMAWKNLNFGCPASKCYQYVDEYGMSTEE